MMSKVLNVAAREYKATAMTKAFIIGVFIAPAVALAVIPLIFVLMAGMKAPKLEGTIAVIDRSGEVLPGLEARFSAAAVQARTEAQREAVREAMTRMGPSMPGDARSEQAMDLGTRLALGEQASLSIEPLPPDTDLETAQRPIRGGTAKDGGRIALLVIDPDAVRRSPESESFGAYQMYVKPKLHLMVQEDIRSVARDAVLEARYKAHGYDAAEIRAMTTVGAPPVQELTETGERESSEFMAAILPTLFMVLLLFSVMIGGQFLVTTTIEEKSNRLAEVLLSAVSPMQLMAGKIIGQMFVGFTLMAIYGGIGMVGLIGLARADVISVGLIVYMIAAYVISYFLIAGVMAAIGAAVNDYRESQTLLVPVILILMIPYFLAMPISMNPDSVFAVVCSHIPPISPFTMLIRMTSTSPPPAWEVLISLVVAGGAVIPVLWAAGKVYRIGLLMHGKPPNLGTLVKWIRMA